MNFNSVAVGHRRTLRVPRRRGLEELVQLPEPFLRVGIGRLVVRRFGDAFVEHAHGGVELTLLPLVHHDAEHLPDVFQALEVVALVAEDVHQLDDPPPLQLLEARADVGSGHLQRFDDVVRVERIRGDEQQGVHLRRRSG